MQFDFLLVDAREADKDQTIKGMIEVTDSPNHLSPMKVLRPSLQNVQIIYHP